MAVLLVSGCSRYGVITKEQETAEYDIVAKTIDLAAVDSYPQSIVSRLASDGMMRLSIRIALDSERYRKTLLDQYEYTSDVSEYLLPSTKIESDSSIVEELANTIAPREDDILKIAQAAAKWTSENIRYDQDLAGKIDRGESDTISAMDTIQKKRGTCSEYTNVFIALMRNKGVPARFVCGKVYGGGDHAWAEIYLYGTGWVPVDPQGGYLGVTNRYIKLFQGADFADIGVRLRDVKASIGKTK